MATVADSRDQDESRRKLYMRLKPSYIQKLAEGMPRIMQNADAGEIPYPDFTASNTPAPTKSGKSSDRGSKSKGKSNDSAVESLKKGSAKSNAALNVATSIVDFLKSLGEDSSFSSRKQLAKKYGIEGEYTGSAEQNTAMLKAAKSSSRSSRSENAIESGPKPMLGNDASSRPTTMPDDNFRVKRMRPDGMPPSDMPEATDSIGKPVPPSVDTEDMARMDIDRQLLDQNREFVTQKSLADGTWKSYTSFIKQMVRDGMSLQDLPNFMEYSRVSPEQRSNDEYN